MRNRGLERYAPLAGVVFVLLVVLAVIIGGETPDNNDSAIKIARFWKDNDSEQIWSAVIGAWGTAAFVWFAASFRSVLRRVEGEPGRLSAINYGGAILAAGGLLASLSFSFATADAADDAGPAALKTMTLINNGFFFPIAVGFGLFFLAAGVLVLRARFAPVWLGALTLLIGIACITPIGFFAILAGLVWILVISVLLFLGRFGARPAPTAPTASAAT